MKTMLKAKTANSYHTSGDKRLLYALPWETFVIWKVLYAIATPKIITNDKKEV